MKSIIQLGQIVDVWSLYKRNKKIISSIKAWITRCEGCITKVELYLWQVYKKRWNTCSRQVSVVKHVISDVDRALSHCMLCTSIFKDWYDEEISFCYQNIVSSFVYPIWALVLFSFIPLFWNQDRVSKVQRIVSSKKIKSKNYRKETKIFPKKECQEK